ncbi:MAG: DMT family transporter [bacterium]
MKPIDMLMAVAVAALWGMGFVVAKAGMSHFPPIFLMALRFAVAALCLLWFFRAHWALLPRMFAIALVGATLQYSLTFTGLAGIDVSTAALLIQLEVPFGILLAWIVLRDRIGLRQASGIALAFFGIVQIVGAPSLSDSLTHVALVIGGAFSWAIGQIMVKRLGQVGGFALTTWMAVMATPQLLIASALLESGQLAALASASLEAWAAVAYLGLGMTVLAYAMWYRLLGLYPLSRVMPFLLLLPLTSLAGGILFLDEHLTVPIAIGGVCILTGVAIINLRLRATD